MAARILPSVTWASPPTHAPSLPPTHAPSLSPSSPHPASIHTPGCVPSVFGLQPPTSIFRLKREIKTFLLSRSPQAKPQRSAAPQRTTSEAAPKSGSDCYPQVALPLVRSTRSNSVEKTQRESGATHQNLNKSPMDGNRRNKSLICNLSDINRKSRKNVLTWFVTLW